MKIDRNDFLYLASMLAVGCGSGGASPAVVSASPDPIEPTPSAEPPPAPEISVSCADIEPPPGPLCESIFLSIIHCKAYVAILDEAAAGKALRCFTERSATEAVCDFDAVEDCYDIAASTEDARHEAACDVIVPACIGAEISNDLDESKCLRALTAVRDPLEEEMAECLREGCSALFCVNRLHR